MLKYLNQELSGHKWKEVIHEITCLVTSWKDHISPKFSKMFLPVMNLNFQSKTSEKI